MRLAIAGDRLVEPIELRQRPAAIEPRAGMLGRGRECAVVRLDRLGVTAKLVSARRRDCNARPDGRARAAERRIEFGKRLLEKAERGMGEAAIEPRLGMLRHARQNLLEFGERLLRRGRG